MIRQPPWLCHQRAVHAQHAHLWRAWPLLAIFSRTQGLHGKPVEPKGFVVELAKELSNNMDALPQRLGKQLNDLCSELGTLQSATRTTKLSYAEAVRKQTLYSSERENWTIMRNIQTKTYGSYQDEKRTEKPNEVQNGSMNPSRNPNWGIIWDYHPGYRGP